MSIPPAPDLPLAWTFSVQFYEDTGWQESVQYWDDAEEALEAARSFCEDCLVNNFLVGFRVHRRGQK